MRSRISRRLVQYYMALRLSAGAALLILPDELPSDCAPIVRQSSTTGPGGFDRREVIVRAGKIAVVTLPLSSPHAPSEPTIGLN